MLCDGVEQRRGLQPVARRVARLFAHAALVDGLLHRSHDEALAELLDAAVAELEHLGEVVTGVDVHDREGELRGAEGLLGDAQQDDGVLAAREQQHRPLELGRDLAHDEDGLGLEGVQVGGAVPHDTFAGGSRFDHLVGVDLWCAEATTSRRRYATLSRPK